MQANATLWKMRDSRLKKFHWMELIDVINRAGVSPICKQFVTSLKANLLWNYWLETWERGTKRFAILLLNGKFFPSSFWTCHTRDIFGWNSSREVNFYIPPIDLKYLIYLIFTFFNILHFTIKFLNNIIVNFIKRNFIWRGKRSSQICGLNLKRILNRNSIIIKLYEEFIYIDI